MKVKQNHMLKLWVITICAIFSGCATIAPDNIMKEVLSLEAKGNLEEAALALQGIKIQHPKDARIAEYSARIQEKIQRAKMLLTESEDFLAKKQFKLALEKCQASLSINRNDQTAAMHQARVFREAAVAFIAQAEKAAVVCDFAQAFGQIDELRSMGGPASDWANLQDELKKWKSLDELLPVLESQLREGRILPVSEQLLAFPKKGRMPPCLSTRYTAVEQTTVKSLAEYAEASVAALRYEEASRFIQQGLRLRPEDAQFTQLMKRVSDNQRSSLIRQAEAHWANKNFGACFFALVSARTYGELGLNADGLLEQCAARLRNGNQLSFAFMGIENPAIAQANVLAANAAPVLSANIGERLSAVSGRFPEVSRKELEVVLQELEIRTSDLMLDSDRLRRVKIPPAHLVIVGNLVRCSVDDQVKTRQLTGTYEHGTKTVPNPEYEQGLQTLAQLENKVVELKKVMDDSYDRYITSRKNGLTGFALDFLRHANEGAKNSYNEARNSSRTFQTQLRRIPKSFTVPNMIQFNYNQDEHIRFASVEIQIAVLDALLGQKISGGDIVLRKSHNVSDMFVQGDPQRKLIHDPLTLPEKDQVLQEALRKAHLELPDMQRLFAAHQTKRFLHYAELMNHSGDPVKEVEYLARHLITNGWDAVDSNQLLVRVKPHLPAGVHPELFRSQVTRLVKNIP